MLTAFQAGTWTAQGDPLAPYLFNLVMERLAYDIQSEVNKRNWKPIHISRGGTGISHLFFADDLMLFGEATDLQARRMIECLNRLSNDSGLKVNLSKSQIFCSPNTSAGTKRVIAESMGIPLSPHLGSYLGIPLINKRVSKNTFNFVIDKMRRKLATWQADSLSMAGRRVLVQSSLATIPTYAMQSMALPVSTCNEIDKICRNFLWGHSDDTRKIHTVSWSEVCKPRDEGGLGLRKARDFNLALLTKLGWQILTNEDKLWVKVMKEKYVNQGGFFNTSSTNPCSWSWRSMMKGKETLKKGVKWKIGTGSAVNFWDDWWLGNGPIANYENVQVPEAYKHATVGQFITRERNWNVSILEGIIPDNILDAIRAYPISVEDNRIDTRSWPHSGTGLLSVKSAFSLIAGHSEDERKEGWVWKIHCTERIKIFIWKISQNGLLVNFERRRRGLTTQSDCPRCDEGDETLDHIFRRCPMAVDCWNQTNIPFGFNINSHMPLMKWIEKNCSHSQNSPDNINWRYRFPYLLWNLWKARNHFVFNGANIPAGETIRRANKEAREARHLMARNDGPMRGSQVWVVWTPPRHGVVKLNTDGAMKASSGIASAGGVFRDHAGSWIVGFTTKIGTTNSFIAELWGLREGLKIAIDRGFNKLIVETDSNAMVQALIKDTESRPETDTLIADCNFLMRKIHEVDLIHVYREGNHCADYLANMGQSGEWGTTVLDHPPDGVHAILDKDARNVATRRIR